ncbi:MAG: hypothetical protein L0Y71_10580 [Gemmataceae bacterium]|nr:hypothetical protein [Gemmataceae bacterium]
MQKAIRPIVAACCLAVSIGGAGCSRTTPSEPAVVEAPKKVKQPERTGLAAAIEALERESADDKAAPSVAIEPVPQAAAPMALNPKAVEGPSPAVTPAVAAVRSPSVYTADELLGLHEVIRPRPGEALWAEIPWITDLWEARKKAAAEGKPIFVWSAMADPIGCT